LVLASVVFLGTTVQAQSSSDSPDSTVGLTGELSLGTTIGTPSVGASSVLAGSEFRTIDGLAGSSEPIEITALSRTASAIKPAPAGVLQPVTSFPIVNDYDQTATRATTPAFSPTGMVRPLVFWTFGFLLMRRLQHRWKT
jgi:hypothetical protein